MNVEHPVVTSDVELDAALAQGRLASARLPLAVHAEFRSADDAVIVVLSTGVTLTVPRRLLTRAGSGDTR
ncbi:MAG: hypothetical protein ACR2JY_05065 [Chloroflexota bacterium]